MCDIVQVWDSAGVRNYRCKTVRSYSTCVRQYRCQTVHVWDSAGVRHYRCKTVWQYRCDTVQVWDSTGVRVCFTGETSPRQQVTVSSWSQSMAVAAAASDTDAGPQDSADSPSAAQTSSRQSTANNTTSSTAVKRTSLGVTFNRQKKPNVRSLSFIDRSVSLSEKQISSWDDQQLFVAVVCLFIAFSYRQQIFKLVLLSRPLEYRNTAPAGLPGYDGYLLDRLRSALNAAARLVHSARKCDHITLL